MKALREAFSKVMSDPDVSVDARKKGLEPAAVSGDELEGLVKELVQPPEVIQRMKHFSRIRRASQYRRSIMFKPVISTLSFIVMVFFCGFDVAAQSDFYRGKTIVLVHGRSSGGSGDFRARSVAPFLQKYIPGNPTIVQEYMDGAGGRKAANYIYNSARPDGLTIGSVGGGVVVSAVLGETGVQYDLDKLHFVGTPYSASHYILITRREAGLSTLDKLRQATAIRMGSQAVGHTNYTVGRIMAWLLGLKDIKEVIGFTNPERRAALIRGEIDGYAVSDSGVLPEWLEKSLVDLHVIFAVPRENKHPQFHSCPKLTASLRQSGSAGS